MEFKNNILNEFRSELIKSIFYAFAMMDYEGEDSITPRGLFSSYLFDDVELNLINLALATAKQDDLIVWDEVRIGAVRLTSKGISQFQAIRDVFFDDEENKNLKKMLFKCHSKMAENLNEQGGNDAKTPVYPGYRCPRSGKWFSIHLNKTIEVKDSEIMPGPEQAPSGNGVSWFFVGN